MNRAVESRVAEAVKNIIDRGIQCLFVRGKSLNQGDRRSELDDCRRVARLELVNEDVRGSVRIPKGLSRHASAVIENQRHGNRIISTSLCHVERELSDVVLPDDKVRCGKTRHGVCFAIEDGHFVSDLRELNCRVGTALAHHDGELRVGLRGVCVEGVFDGVGRLI